MIGLHAQATTLDDEGPVSCAIAALLEMCPFPLEGAAPLPAPASAAAARKVLPVLTSAPHPTGASDAPCSGASAPRLGAGCWLLALASGLKVSAYLVTAVSDGQSCNQAVQLRVVLVQLAGCANSTMARYITNEWMPPFHHWLMHDQSSGSPVQDDNAVVHGDPWSGSPAQDDEAAAHSGARRRAPRRSAASVSAGAYAEQPLGPPADEDFVSCDENDAPAKVGGAFTPALAGSLRRERPSAFVTSTTLNADGPLSCELPNPRYPMGVLHA